MLIKRIAISLMLLSAVVMTGCNQTKESAMNGSSKLESSHVESSHVESSSAKSGIAEIYEVHEDGRIYVFYDRALYKEFLSVGETAYRLTRIGSGPNGETMVYGLTNKDKKKGIDSPGVKLFEKKLSPAEAFYGETYRHGRIYVFNTFSDMQTVRQFGHPNFFYTEIGSGPKGETVVYVLNKNTKKKKPVELIKAFKDKNA